MSGSPAGLARAVIQFWCDELTSEQHWKKDPAMDRHIAERFGKVRAEVLRTKAAGWRDSPETLAAAIILLDQFSRNMFRGKARAFEADPLALELCNKLNAPKFRLSALRALAMIAPEDQARPLLESALTLAAERPFDRAACLFDLVRHTNDPTEAEAFYTDGRDILRSIKAKEWVADPAARPWLPVLL